MSHKYYAVFDKKSLVCQCHGSAPVGGFRGLQPRQYNITLHMKQLFGPVTAKQSIRLD